MIPQTPASRTTTQNTTSPTADAAPAPDTLATLVDEIAWTMARRRAAVTRHLLRSGITGSHVMVLFNLRMRGDMPMNKLADLLGIGQPNLCGMIDRMEEHGLVERRRVPDDRRLVIVALTDAGRRIPDEIEGIQRELLAAAFATVDEVRLRGCLAALREAAERTNDTDIGRACVPAETPDTTDLRER